MSLKYSKREGDHLVPWIKLSLNHQQEENRRCMKLFTEDLKDATKLATTQEPVQNSKRGKTNESK